MYTVNCRSDACYKTNPLVVKICVFENNKFKNINSCKWPFLCTIYVNYIFKARMTFKYWLCIQELSKFKTSFKLVGFWYICMNPLVLILYRLLLHKQSSSCIYRKKINCDSIIPFLFCWKMKNFFLLNTKVYLLIMVS